MYLANYVSDPEMIDFVWLFFFSFSRISDSFHQILWFCPDLESDLNFMGFPKSCGNPAPSHHKVITQNNYDFFYQLKFQENASMKFHSNTIILIHEMWLQIVVYFM